MSSNKDNSNNTASAVAAPNGKRRRADQTERMKEVLLSFQSSAEKVGTTNQAPFSTSDLVLCFLRHLLHSQQVQATIIQHCLKHKMLFPEPRGVSEMRRLRNAFLQKRLTRQNDEAIIQKIKDHKKAFEATPSEQRNVARQLEGIMIYILRTWDVDKKTSETWVKPIMSELDALTSKEQTSTFKNSSERVPLKRKVPLVFPGASILSIGISLYAAMKEVYLQFVDNYFMSKSVFLSKLPNPDFFDHISRSSHEALLLLANDSAKRPEQEFTSFLHFILSFALCSERKPVEGALLTPVSFPSAAATPPPPLPPPTSVSASSSVSSASYFAPASPFSQNVDDGQHKNETEGDSPATTAAKLEMSEVFLTCWKKNKAKYEKGQRYLDLYDKDQQQTQPYNDGSHCVLNNSTTNSGDNDLYSSSSPLTFAGGELRPIVASASQPAPLSSASSLRTSPSTSPTSSSSSTLWPRNESNDTSLTWTRKKAWKHRSAAQGNQNQVGTKVAHKNESEEEDEEGEERYEEEESEEMEEKEPEESEKSKDSTWPLQNEAKRPHVRQKPKQGSAVFMMARLKRNNNSHRINNKNVVNKQAGGGGGGGGGGNYATFAVRRRSRSLESLTELFPATATNNHISGVTSMRTGDEASDEEPEDNNINPLHVSTSAVPSRLREHEPSTTATTGGPKKRSSLRRKGSDVMNSFRNKKKSGQKSLSGKSEARADPSSSNNSINNYGTDGTTLHISKTESSILALAKKMRNKRKKQPWAVFYQSIVNEGPRLDIQPPWTMGYGITTNASYSATLTLSTSSPLSSSTFTAFSSKKKKKQKAETEVESANSIVVDEEDISIRFEEEAGGVEQQDDDGGKGAENEDERKAARVICIEKRRKHFKAIMRKHGILPEVRGQLWRALAYRFALKKKSNTGSQRKKRESSALSSSTYASFTMPSSSSQSSSSSPCSSLSSSTYEPEELCEQERGEKLNEKKEKKDEEATAKENTSEHEKAEGDEGTRNKESEEDAANEVSCDETQKTTLSEGCEVWGLREDAVHKYSYEEVLKNYEGKFSVHIRQINKDLYRTFPDKEQYQSEEGISSLRRLLAAYSWSNPLVGYCQSMNFIGGLLLLYMSEEESYWMLHILLRVYLPDYYSLSLLGVHVDSKVFLRLIAEKLPKVHKHLQKHEVSLDPIINQWFLCLWISVLPFETALRVLDGFFYEGSKMLFRVAFALLRSHEKEILQQTSDVDILQLIHSLPHQVRNTDAFLELAYSKKPCSREYLEELQRVERQKLLERHPDLETRANDVPMENLIFEGDPTDSDISETMFSPPPKRLSSSASLSGRDGEGKQSGKTQNKLWQSSSASPGDVQEQQTFSEKSSRSLSSPGGKRRTLTSSSESSPSAPLSPYSPPISSISSGPIVIAGTRKPVPPPRPHRVINLSAATASPLSYSTSSSPSSPSRSRRTETSPASNQQPPQRTLQHLPLPDHHQQHESDSDAEEDVDDEAYFLITRRRKLASSMAQLDPHFSGRFTSMSRIVLSAD
ncbi:TBC1 domain member 4 [Balamuthia mandrillaris]